MKFRLTKSAIARLLILFVAVVNLFLVAIGREPIEIANETITAFASFLATVAAGVWAWWKNNSATHGAKVGDRVKNLVNNGNLDFLSEVQMLIDKYETMHLGSDYRREAREDNTTDEEETDEGDGANG